MSMKGYVGLCFVLVVVASALSFAVFGTLRTIELWGEVDDLKADVGVMEIRLDELEKSIGEAKSRMLAVAEEQIKFDLSVLHGVASWYGPGFQGRRTANGEKYDQNGLTIAHRTLPFGTVVVVTRLDTGESVLARVTDRGPYVDGRTFDLSLGVARRLGMLDQGLTAVTVAALIPKADRR